MSFQISVANISILFGWLKVKKRPHNFWPKFGNTDHCVVGTGHVQASQTHCAHIHIMK